MQPNHKRYRILVHQNTPLQNVLTFKDNSHPLILEDKESTFLKHPTKEILIQEHNLNLSILHKRNNYQRLKILENWRWNRLKKYKDFRKWKKWHWIIWKYVVVVEPSDLHLYTVKKNPHRTFTLKWFSKIFLTLILAHINNLRWVRDFNETKNFGSFLLMIF